MEIQDPQFVVFLAKCWELKAEIKCGIGKRVIMRHYGYLQSQSVWRIFVHHGKERLVHHGEISGKELMLIGLPEKSQNHRIHPFQKMMLVVKQWYILLVELQKGEPVEGFRHIRGEYGDTVQIRRQELNSTLCDKNKEIGIVAGFILCKGVVRS